MHKRLELNQLNRLLNEDERFLMTKDEFVSNYPYCIALALSENTHCSGYDTPLLVCAVYDMTKVEDIISLRMNPMFDNYTTHLYDAVTNMLSYKESLDTFWAVLYPKEYIKNVITEAGYSC